MSSRTCSVGAEACRIGNCTHDQRAAEDTLFLNEKGRCPGASSLDGCDGTGRAPANDNHIIGIFHVANFSCCFMALHFTIKEKNLVAVDLDREQDVSILEEPVRVTVVSRKVGHHPFVPERGKIVVANPE